MPRDLAQLLHDAAVDDGTPLDPSALVDRGLRRRRIRHVASGGGVALGFVLVAALVVGPLTPDPTPGIVDEPPGPSPTQPTTTPTQPTPRPSPTGTPATGPFDPALDLDTFPPLGDRDGVAVDTGGSVVFLGVDGSVHGYVGDLELDTGGPDEGVPGPLRVRMGSLAAPITWLAPAQGQVVPGDLVLAPLQGEADVVAGPSESDPGFHLVLGFRGEEIARFGGNAPRYLSDGHRTVTWVDCGDGGTDPANCEPTAYDADMGGGLTLAPGCWVADDLGDLFKLLSCTEWWDHEDGAAWLETSGILGEARRFGAPPAAGRGWYRNAFLDGGRIVATWVRSQFSYAAGSCRPTTAVRIDLGSGEVAPLADGLERSSAVLGVTLDGIAIVVESGASCLDGRRGRVLAIPRDGTPTVLYEGRIAHAEMWGGFVDLDGSAPGS